MAEDDFIRNDRFVARFVPVTSRTQIQYWERPENLEEDNDGRKSWASFLRKVENPDFQAEFRGQPRRNDAGQE